MQTWRNVDPKLLTEVLITAARACADKRGAHDGSAGGENEVSGRPPG